MRNFTKQRELKKYDHADNKYLMKNYNRSLKATVEYLNKNRDHISKNEFMIHIESIEILCKRIIELRNQNV
jgi:hypothetical protein